MTAIYIHRPFYIDEGGYTRLIFVVLPREHIRLVRISGGSLEIITGDNHGSRFTLMTDPMEFPYHDERFYDDLCHPDVDMDVTWTWNRKFDRWDRTENARPTKEQP